MNDMSYPTRQTSPERLSLITFDKPVFGVVAQYNPAQLQIEESVQWTPSASARGEGPPLEYAVTSPRTLSLELFFDTYEEPHGLRNVKTRYIEPLSRLMQLIDPESPKEEHQRPPLVDVRWDQGLPPFRGVISSVSTKLTMFLADGTPVRATCAIKLLEASLESFLRRRR